jgi:polyhydroxybutyrate depolymerase
MTSESMRMLFRPSLSQLITLGAVLYLTTACHSTSFAENQSSPPSHSPQPIASPQVGNSTESLFVQGQQRTAFLHVPQSYRPKQAVPLVLVFHGYGGQGKGTDQSTGFSTLADQAGFIVAYPDGLDKRWRIGTDDDIAFTSALIRQIQQRYQIDSRRIYVTGISNGGFLVQQLACRLPNQIAGFASVAATLPDGLQSACPTQAPTSMLMINGTDDRKVPWNGGNRPYGSILSVPNSVKFWQQKNGCSAIAMTQNLTARVQRDRFTQCRAGAEVELVTLKGAGHLFPRGGGSADALIDGSREIWQFFQRHSLNRPMN